MEEMEIARILRALRRGEFVATYHAQSRMKQRGVELGDICSVGRTCYAKIPQDNGVYKFTGLDLNSEPLTVIATYELGAVIITVF